MALRNSAGKPGTPFRRRSAKIAAHWRTAAVAETEMRRSGSAPHRSHASAPNGRPRGPQQTGEVVEADGIGRMRRAQRRLRHFQRFAVKRLGLFQSPRRV